MTATVAYNLGGVALPYATFRWPKYRGTVARVVEFDCPGEMYTALAGLAAGLNGSPTFMEVTGPDTPGRNTGTTTLRIDGIYILRVVRVSSQLCKVYACDSRVVLARRVADMDFQIRFGDGYLEGTNESTHQAAVKALVKSIDVLRSRVDGGAYVTFPPGVSLRDGTALAGLPLPIALGGLLDDAAADLVVNNRGFFKFPGREDIDTSGHKLPQRSSYSWREEPGWLSTANVVLGRPREVRSYYHERHCLRMIGVDGTGTLTVSGPAELQVFLEQVYASDGQYFTLEDLLVHWGFASNTITDAQIADAFWTDTFENTALYASFGSIEFGEVHKAIRDGWRRLWRVKYYDSKGHIGGWTDWAAGKLNADGSIDPVAVECPWVDFMGSISPSAQGNADFIGSESTKNHTDNAPFTVQWDGGPETGVLRLVQGETPTGGIAIPGALRESLGVKKVNTVEDGAGNAYNLNEIILIEREDITKARFVTSFEIKIYLCATRRMPNNETRWHVEKTPTKYANADVDFVELPPGEIMCYRDYVSAEPGHSPLSDGLGPILNQKPLSDDAERRMVAWKLMHTASAEGSGLAESIHLFRDFEVEGAISEIALESTLEGEACALRTRITVGNLADETQRQRVAARRIATQRIAERGGMAVGV